MYEPNLRNLPFSDRLKFPAGKSSFVYFPYGRTACAAEGVRLSILTPNQEERLDHPLMKSA